MSPRQFLGLALLIVFAPGCDSASPLRFFRRSTEPIATLVGDRDDLDSETVETSSPLATDAGNTSTQMRLGDQDAAELAALSILGAESGAAAGLIDGGPEAAAPDETVAQANSVAAAANADPGASAPQAATALASAVQPADPVDAELPVDEEKSFGELARRALDALRIAPSPSEAPSRDALAGDIAQFERFPFEFSLSTVAGERVDSKKFNGQLMVIDVWATWCGPCRRAIPDFIAIQQEYESHGVQVVGITCDSADPADAPDTARKAYNIGQQLDVNYPLLVDDGTTIDQIPGFRGYPTTLFMTPDGQVRYKVTGVQSRAKLAAMVETILQM